MKKIVIVLLIMVMSVLMLVGCNGTDNEKDIDSNVGQNTDTNQDTDEDGAMDSELENNENSQSDISADASDYESVELEAGNVKVNVSSISEKIGVEDRDYTTVLLYDAGGGIVLTIKEYESADAYAEALVADLGSADVAPYELETMTYGNVTVNYFTLSYSRKNYSDDVKELTQEEIENLGIEYTLEEYTENHYVIEIGNGLILCSMDEPDEGFDMGSLEYIEIEVVE